MRRMLVLPAIVAAGLLTSACVGGNTTEHRILSGGGIGSGLGPGASLTDGCVSCGVGVGTGVGAGTAHLVDQ